MAARGIVPAQLKIARLKKVFLLLFAAVIFFAACQKDTGTQVDITQGDMTAINAQLKGTWVFPVQTFSVVDTSGQQLSGTQNSSAPAFRFDGGTHVTVIYDIHTEINATYSLSADKGYVYLTINYPNDPPVKYKILRADASTLELTSTQPYIYTAGGSAIQASSVSNTTLKRQNSADVTANMVRVIVMSDSSFNAGIFVTHDVPYPADTLTTLNTTVNNTTGSYSYSFIARTGDHLTVDMFGSVSKTSLYAYYNGVPLSGKLDTAYNEIVTTEGWDVP
ncbi:MAG TPA: hypothetical protein VHC47_06040 [Mucilaginibacter sp.]|nr:hypothetical protein [Mucilaginibacter sp.]